MESLIKQHNEKFGVEPYTIGMFWDDPEYLEEQIAQSIENNTPYDEYEMLSDEEKKAFDSGDLLF